MPSLNNHKKLNFEVKKFSIKKFLSRKGRWKVMYTNAKLKTCSMKVEVQKITFLESYIGINL